MRGFPPRGSVAGVCATGRPLGMGWLSGSANDGGCVRGCAAADCRVRAGTGSRDVAALVPPFGQSPLSMDRMRGQFRGDIDRMSGTTAGGSVERVRAALAAAGHPDTITAFPDGTRTAADAAAAVGATWRRSPSRSCFRTGERAAVIVTSGANRVDPARAGAALGVKLGRADPDWVRLTTGFAVGGVAPVGHLAPPLMLLDEDLLVLDPVWAAAGSPRHVFRTTAADLLRMTGALVAAIRG